MNRTAIIIEVPRLNLVYSCQTEKEVHTVYTRLVCDMKVEPEDIERHDVTLH